MKTKPFHWITAGLAAVMISPAPALEAPADNAPPPPPASRKEPARLPEFKLAPDQPVTPPAAVVGKSAFLGVVSGQVPGCLADHLGLEAGSGIIVRSLVPDGPAAKAGIAVNDVILAVAGKPIHSPEDISNQVTAHKPGDSVTLERIHKGVRSTVDVALCVRPEGLAIAEPMAADPMQLDNIPKDIADRIKAAIAGNVGALDLNPGAGADAMPPQIEEAMREMQKRMEGAIAQGGFTLLEDGGDKVETKSSATFRMKDNDGSVEVRSTDGSKEVTIRDQGDRVTWSGPWDTAQDKAAAPEDVRRRMQGLNLDSNFKGNGMRFQMNPPKPDR